jgi:hypothetical protein
MALSMENMGESNTTGSNPTVENPKNTPEYQRHAAAGIAEQVIAMDIVNADRTKLGETMVSLRDALKKAGVTDEQYDQAMLDRAAQINARSGSKTQ